MISLNCESLHDIVGLIQGKLDREISDCFLLNEHGDHNVLTLNINGIRLTTTQRFCSETFLFEFCEEHIFRKCLQSNQVKRNPKDYINELIN